MENGKIELDFNVLFDDMDDMDDVYTFNLDFDTSFDFEIDDDFNIIEKKELNIFKEDFNKNIDKDDVKCYNMYVDDKESKKTTKTKERKKMFDIDLNVIKRAYKIKNLNQKDLAKKLNISERSINRKLNNETDFTAVELLKLIDLLDIDARTLLKKGDDINE